MVDFPLLLYPYVCTVLLRTACLCRSGGRGNSNSLQASKELESPLPPLLHAPMRMYNLPFLLLVKKEYLPVETRTSNLDGVVQ
jgi:hypothetical protein